MCSPIWFSWDEDKESRVPWGFLDGFLYNCFPGFINVPLSSDELRSLLPFVSSFRGILWSVSDDGVDCWVSDCGLRCFGLPGFGLTIVPCS